MADPSIETSEVLLPGGMPGFIARPRSDGPHPVIIHMHERYGLVQHTRDLAMRSAADGFLVLAPNFFFKHKDQAALNKGDARYDMSDSESNGLMRAALAFLADDRGADLTRLAVAGYCQTGRHPLVLAAEVPIRAAVVWYGAASTREWVVNARQPKPLEEVIAALSCPVFGCFGAADHIISVEDVRRLRTCLENHNKSYEIHLLAGAPHGWLNDTMPGRYRKPQAEAGWAAQQRFLKTVLAKDWKPGDVSWRFEAGFAPDYDFAKNVRLE